MDSLRRTAGTLVVLAATGALGAFGTQVATAASSRVAVAGQTQCAAFVAAKWVNPYPPHEAGTHYQVVLTGKAFTCAKAEAYVKAFVAQKITPLKATPFDGLVKHGPAGYSCTSGISNIKTAYQGNCRAAHPTPSSSSFSWGPYNDS